MAKKKADRLRDPHPARRASAGDDQQLEFGDSQRFGSFATPASAQAHQAFIDRIKSTDPCLTDAHNDDYDWLR